MLNSSRSVNHKRLKVLLCCYACDPHFGSEPGAGWNFARIISQFHDTHILVESKFKNNILKYVEAHADEAANMTFHFIKKSRHRTLRKFWPPSYYIFYKKWHKEAYTYAKALHEKEHFDLVHQVTLAGYRMPGYLWKLDIPFIWGPIGGLNQTAWKAIPSMGLYGCIFYTLRNLINLYQRKWSSDVLQAIRHTHTIITSDPDTCDIIQQLWGHTPVVLREVGVTTSRTPQELSDHKENTPLQVCWAGVHEPRKALNLLIKALPYCQESIHVNVFGSGPCTNKWKKLANNLKVGHQISFHGRIPHNQIYDIMAASHALCLSSLSEGGTTNIVMEALQQGLPVIALNHCSFASVVDDSCGIKIDIDTPEKMAIAIAKALDTLAKNETLRKKLAAGALERGKHFTWESKMDVINQIYAQALANSPLSPS